MCRSLLFYIIDNFCMWSSLVSGSLYIHASCNMKLTTPCETMLSQFFKNLDNIFFVVSASCSTCSEFHLLFLTTRCRCSVTVLSTKLLCCNTIPSVHSSSTLNKCSDWPSYKGVHSTFVLELDNEYCYYFLLSVLCKRTTGPDPRLYAAGNWVDN